MRHVLYSENGVRPSEPKPNEAMRAKANASPSSIHYTTIDFQKTVAIANTSKPTVEPGNELSQKGCRQTRHDSSADDLE